MLTATAPSTIAAHKLRRMLAASPTWLAAITGVIYPDSDNASGVYLRDCRGDTPRPHAVVSLGQGSKATLASGGFSNGLLWGGSLGVYLAVDTPVEYWDDQVSAEFFAGNLFDGTLFDVANLANADDPTAADGECYLNAKSIQQLDFGSSPPEDWPSTGRFHYALYLVEWGDA
jgi:hypothetical protein